MDGAPITRTHFILPSRCEDADCGHPHCIKVRQMELWVCPVCREGLGKKARYYLIRGVLFHERCELGRAYGSRE